MSAKAKRRKPEPPDECQHCAGAEHVCLICCAPILWCECETEVGLTIVCISCQPIDIRS